MLDEARLALRVKTHAYDAEIMQLIYAAAEDLTRVGIGVSGIKMKLVEGVVIDSSTINEPLKIRAILTYVRANFGSPADYDRLKASYDEQKAQLEITEDVSDES